MKTNLFLLFTFLFNLFTTQKILANNLQQLISNGLENSFGIKITDLNVSKASLELSNNYASFLPSLSLSANRNYEKGESYLDGQKVKNSDRTTSLGVSANWVLWNHFENITNARNSKISLQTQNIERNKTIQEYIIGLIEKYLNHQLLLNRNQILKNKEEQSLWADEKAQRMVKLGVKTKLDSYDTEIDLANVRRDLLDSQYKIENSLRNLAVLINSKKEIEIDKVDLLTFTPYYMKDIDRVIMNSQKNLRQILDEKNYDIKVAKLNLKKSKISLGQKWLGQWPVLSANLRHDINLNGKVESTIPENERGSLQTTTLALQLNWEIWSWFSKRRQVAIDTKDYNISFMQYRQNILSTYNDLISKIHEYEILKRSLGTSEIILEKSNKQYIYSKEMYKLGRITVFELRESQNRLFEAKNTNASRLKDQFLLAGKIIYLLGESLIPPQSNYKVKGIPNSHIFKFSSLKRLGDD